MSGSYSADGVGIWLAGEAVSEKSSLWRDWVRTECVSQGIDAAFRMPCGRICEVSLVSAAGSDRGGVAVWVAVVAKLRVDACWDAHRSERKMFACG